MAAKASLRNGLEPSLVQILVLVAINRMGIAMTEVDEGFE